MKDSLLYIAKPDGLKHVSTVADSSSSKRGFLSCPRAVELFLFLQSDPAILDNDNRSSCASANARTVLRT